MSGFSRIPIGPKLAVITRDMTASSGDASTTGVGFKPSAIVALGTCGNSTTQLITVNGIADAAKSSASMAVGGSTNIKTTNLLEALETGGTNAQAAVVSSYDADGFTLTWTKAGTPSSGTFTAYLLCIPPL